MKAACLVAALVALALGACSKEEAALEARLGMSIEDYARQDDGLADRMRDHIVQGVLFQKERYRSFTVLHPHRDEALVVFRDRQVEVGLFADWSTSIGVIARTDVLADEVSALMDRLRSSDLDCTEHQKNTMSIAAFRDFITGRSKEQGKVDPCKVLPASEYASLRTGLECHTTFEGARQELELVIMCWQDELPSVPRLAYDFRYRFSGSDEFIWVRPHYERKYPPLQSLRDVERMQRAMDERNRTIRRPSPFDAHEKTP